MRESRRAVITGGVGIVLSSMAGCSSNPETPDASRTSKISSTPTDRPTERTVVDRGGVSIDNGTDSTQQLSLTVTRRPWGETSERGVRTLTATEPDAGSTVVAERDVAVSGNERRSLSDVVPLYDRLTEYGVFVTVESLGSTALVFGAAGPGDYGFLRVDIRDDGDVELGLAIP